MRSISYILMTIALIAACTGPKPASTINEQASIPASFRFAKLGLKPITSAIRPKERTMSTLYGNGPARQSMLHDSTAVGEKVWALVTWVQQDDPKWYGAKMPGTLTSLELVKTNASIGQKEAMHYERYEGTNLRLQADSSQRSQRLETILAMKPAVLP